jgi:hypothetical protein
LIRGRGTLGAWTRPRDPRMSTGMPRRR